MKSTKTARSEVAEVQCKVDVVEMRGINVERIEKKVQVILTEVGAKIKHLKEALKMVEEKLALVGDRAQVVEEKGAKVEAEGTKLACKVVEAFCISEEFVEKVDLVVESYIIAF